MPSGRTISSILPLTILITEANGVQSSNDDEISGTFIVSVGSDDLFRIFDHVRFLHLTKENSAGAISLVRNESYSNDHFGTRFGSEQTEDSNATIQIQDDFVLEQVSIIDDGVAKRFRTYLIFQ